MMLYEARVFEKQNCIYQCIKPHAIAEVLVYLVLIEEKYLCYII